MRSLGARIDAAGRAATDERGWKRPAISLVLGLAALVVGSSAVAGGQLPRTQPIDLYVAALGAPDGSPSELTAGAAAIFEAALATEGGVSFEVAQRSVMTARPGGPRIPIPQPTDRFQTIGFADEYLLTVLAQSGFATRDGYYAAIRRGAGGELPTADAPIVREALVRDGVTWRNDGDGWLRTAAPPGIGLDPVSIAVIPRLLRNAGDGKDAPTSPIDEGNARAITDAGAVADVPAVVASDGAAFTRLTDDVRLAFDDLGRLTKVVVVALNTNMEDFDLVVTAEITFDYGDAGKLPTIAAGEASSDEEAQS